MCSESYLKTLSFLAPNIWLLWLWLKGTSQDNRISVGSFPRSPRSQGADNCMLCSSRKWFGPNLYVRSKNYFLCIICSEICAIFMQSLLLWIIFCTFCIVTMRCHRLRNICLWKNWKWWWWQGLGCIRRRRTLFPLYEYISTSVSTFWKASCFIIIAQIHDQYA